MASNLEQLLFHFIDNYISKIELKRNQRCKNHAIKKYQVTGHKWKGQDWPQTCRQCNQISCWHKKRIIERYFISFTALILRVFIIVRMEQEIKLIILLILSFCTFFKVKNFRTPKKTTITDSKANDMTGEDIQNGVNQKDEFDFQKFARIDNDLFPPQPVYKRQKIKEEARNDEYRKTIMTESYIDIESTLIYNNSYFQKSLFGSLANKPIYTNQEYLKEIEHLIADPVLSPMKAEEAPSKKSIPVLNLSTPKKKSILKLKRFGKRAGQSASQKKSSKKKKSVFDIDQQIKKREQQIKILKRMRQNQLLL